MEILIHLKCNQLNAQVKRVIKSRERQKVYLAKELGRRRHGMFWIRCEWAV